MLNWLILSYPNLKSKLIDYAFICYFNLELLNIINCKPYNFILNLIQLLFFSNN